MPPGLRTVKKMPCRAVPNRSHQASGADAFVDRHGRGPQSPSALRALLAETRRRGYAVEDGEVTPGFASVAVAVLDHNGTPLGGVAVTYDSREPVGLSTLVDAVSATAGSLTRRMGGASAPLA